MRLDRQILAKSRKTSRRVRDEHGEKWGGMYSERLMTDDCIEGSVKRSNSITYIIEKFELSFHLVLARKRSKWVRIREKT